MAAYKRAKRRRDERCRTGYYEKYASVTRIDVRDKECLTPGIEMIRHRYEEAMANRRVMMSGCYRVAS